MVDNRSILLLVREAAKKKRLYLPHALRQMNRSDRMITPSEIQRVIEHGEVIEDYPEDVRGHSCLIMGHGDLGRPIHIVCAPLEDYLAIITAYIPNENEWNNDFRVRK